jgi:hypothetical protein
MVRSGSGRPVTVFGQGASPTQASPTIEIKQNASAVCDIIISIQGASSMYNIRLDEAGVSNNKGQQWDADVLSICQRQTKSCGSLGAYAPANAQPLPRRLRGQYRYPNHSEN